MHLPGVVTRLTLKKFGGSSFGLHLPTRYTNQRDRRSAEPYKSTCKTSRRA